MDNKKEDILDETMRGRSRRNSDEPGKRPSDARYIGIAAAAVILTLGAGFGFYFAKSGAYRETFMPNTTINGLKVAGKDIDQVKAMIEEELMGYELKLVERTGAGEVITKDEIGLRTEFEGGLEQILEMQEPMMWIKSLWTEVDYRVGTMLVYDEKLLENRIQELSFMDESAMVEPENAYLSDYQFDTNSYEIVAPVDGTELVTESVKEAIAQAALNLQEEVDLEAAGCYTRPAVLEDEPELVALAAELNRYVGAVVTHRFDEIEEVLDGDEIHTWLTIDGSSVTLDESKAAEYVKALAKKYNTAYEKRPFLTTYGDVVTIPGGSYGWRMNQTKETEAVFEAVKEGAVRTREPEWLQEGASHGEYDYGDTYVEVNLTGQHLFFYKNGELLVECDFVSGNASKGWSTPAGAFPLTYKERNATLRGEDYATPVSYWMPFNGGIGLHDADWRATFGGAIYKTNGSHGCVNLPPKAAKIIYENISKGDPVLCYHLEGTETKKTSKASEVNTSGTASVTKTEENQGVGTSATTKPQTE
ncbi:MAG: L,D-transpeptidase/peptidoglycan binding protein, partial [Lachnospiraceae bacterium]|nr:L,D-transpeptidase/peptidoglycan binding protein [Lachnospiraceae bacterium]